MSQVHSLSRPEVFIIVYKYIISFSTFLTTIFLYQLALLKFLVLVEGINTWSTTQVKNLGAILPFSCPISIMHIWLNLSLSHLLWEPSSPPPDQRLT